MQQIIAVVKQRTFNVLQILKYITIVVLKKQTCLNYNSDFAIQMENVEYQLSAKVLGLWVELKLQRGIGRGRLCS